MNSERSLFLKLPAWLLMVCVSLQAQTKKASDLFEEKAQSKISVPIMPTTGPALEGPIDAGKYMVGPSDVIAVNIWTVPPLNLVLTVTPEGTLIVPTVGEIKVDGITLAEAKRRVLAQIEKKYFSSNPSVTLVNPRDIIVTITGNVRFPGRYVMNAAERVDKLIQMSNSSIMKTKDELSKEEIRKEENPNYQRETASKRDIQVRRRDGTTVRVDLQKFSVTKVDQWDPFLLEGDEVFVSRSDNAKNLFAVYGAVNTPGRIELIPGDNILDAINLAYGFTKRANPDSIELVRFDQASGSLISSVLSADSLTNSPRTNLRLQPGDRIIVREKADTREDYRVFVEGEVKYPGIYPITKNQTKISEVIRRAGGFTEFASVKSAELLRRSVVVDDAQLDRMVRQKSKITPEDNAYVTVEADTRVRRDNVNIDLERLFTGKDETQDIVVQPDDRIIVPSIRKTVYVFGQVASPGNVQFVPGRSVDYYIALSGGYNDDAQRGDVAVIKWTTRQWYEPDKTQIQEGDLIWVPPVVRKPTSYWLAIIGQTASIVSVALSIVLLVLQLNK